jgi:hypothetical protein
MKKEEILVSTSMCGTPSDNRNKGLVELCKTLSDHIETNGRLVIGHSSVFHRKLRAYAYGGKSE